MSLKKIYTSNAPEPVGPYSQAIRSGEYLFCSGQIPLDAKTGEIAGSDIKTQTQKVMKNIEAVLKRENLDFNRIVKVTIFLQNMEDFNSMNEIYASYFSDHKPARSCVEVSKLPKGVKVEVEVLASYV